MKAKHEDTIDTNDEDAIDTNHEDAINTNHEDTAIDTNHEDTGFVVGLIVSYISGNDYTQPETDITLSLY
jgi:hypothetical protein